MGPGAQHTYILLYHRIQPNNRVSAPNLDGATDLSWPLFKASSGAINSGVPQVPQKCLVIRLPPSDLCSKVFGMPLTFTSSCFMNINVAKALPVDWRHAVQWQLAITGTSPSAANETSPQRHLPVSFVISVLSEFGTIATALLCKLRRSTRGCFGSSNNRGLPWLY